MKSKQSKTASAPKRRMHGVFGARRQKTLKEMGIKSNEDYHNYIADCMAGHAAIYR